MFFYFLIQLFIGGCIIAQPASDKDAQSEFLTKSLKSYNPKYLDTEEYSSIWIACYEWETDKLKKGQLAMCIVPKWYIPNWYPDVTQNPQGNCNKKGMSDYFYTQCEFNRLIALGMETLTRKFEVYMFFIPIEEMEEPFIEEVEGGTIASYYPKAGSLVITYKYDMEKGWQEISRVKQGGDNPARIHAMGLAAKLAKERAKQK